MNRYKLTTRFLLLVTITVVAITVLAALPNRSSSSLAPTAQVKSGTIKGEENERDKMPMAVYSASLPADPTERALRLTRGSRYDNRLPKPLHEMPDGDLLRVNHWWVNLPGLPTAQSDAVVLGKVIDANAYMSNDKSNIYSEFTIRTEAVFKDQSSNSLISEGTLTALREGGRVQLPNGRIIHAMSANQGMPRKSRRYVLFLKYNEEAKAYGILTGYKLHGGKVSLLDEVELERFAIYKDMDERSFLETVREAVANPPKAPNDRSGMNQ